MEKRLAHLNWKPMWVSHIGCIKGCLDYLDLAVSDAWLYGATGHAFVINIADVLCPSGPTAWKTKMLARLGSNVGFSLDRVFAVKWEPGFAEAQLQTWDLVRQAIDGCTPCYGWELAVPEFYVVNGYNDEGYLFSGPQADQYPMPKPWDDLGTSDIGIIEMYALSPSEPADDLTTVLQAIEFALEFAHNPSKWVLPKYSAGLAAYDTWAKALENGTADGFGMSYNAEVWYECRCHAVEFLKEAKDRLDPRVGAILDQAIAQYDVVSRKLKSVEELFPFYTRKPTHIRDEPRCRSASEYLRAARSHEEEALAALGDLLDTLSAA